MSMKYIPKYQPHELAKRFNDWLTLTKRFNDWLTKVGPLKGVRLGHDEKLETSLEESSCIIRWEERSQIVKFDQGSIIVHDSGVEPGKAHDLTEMLGRRFSSLSQQRRNNFYRIFGEPEVHDDQQLKYQGGVSMGLQLRAKIVSFPVGKGGKLSPDFFVYSYNMLVKPAKAILLGQEDDPSTDFWKYYDRTPRGP